MGRIYIDSSNYTFFSVEQNKNQKKNDYGFNITAIFMHPLNWLFLIVSFVSFEQMSKKISKDYDCSEF